MANLRGLAYALTGNWLSPHSLHVLVLSLSGLILVAVAFYGARASSDCFIVAVSASSVLSYHFLVHDMSILLLPLAVTLNKFIRAEAAHDLIARVRLRTATLAFISPALVAIDRPVFFASSIPILLFLGALCL
jgi:hypothetical protein